MSGQLLVASDLKELEDFIDDHVPLKELAKFKRDFAVVNALTAYELECGYGLEYCEQDPRFTDEHQKNCQDAIHFLVDWCYQFCEPSEKVVDIELDCSSFRSLFEIADQYSVVWDLMSQLRRGWSTASRIESKIYIAPITELIPGAAIGDRLLFSPDPPDLEIEPNIDLTDLLKRCQAKGIQSSRSLRDMDLVYKRFEYKLPLDLVRQHIAERECLMAHLWVYDPNINVGEYTIAEFRDFWRCLTAICSLHRYLCQMSSAIGVIDCALANLILVKPRKQWIRELSNYSLIPIAKVESMINDLVFSNSKKDGQKRVDITLQPFLPLSDDRLCMSTWLTLHANAEGNLWSLKMNRNANCFSRHTDSKEANWLTDLSKFLSKFEIECLPFKVPTGSGDIDVLLLDRNAKFAVAVQLKSHQPPDRLNEVAQEVRELTKGISQVEKALEWVANNPGEAQARLKNVLLNTLNLKGLVLTSGTTGGGLVKHDHIPIVSERLLRWVIGSPGQRTLMEFWQIASAPQRYLPKLGIHYRDETVEANFAGLQFVSPQGGATIMRGWLPEKDIQFD
ncbi:MAG: hypothetical protein WC028_30295 [Candidatus Obscuribacterales bacterium]